jgi:hypothetical protein
VRSFEAPCGVGDNARNGQYLSVPALIPLRGSGRSPFLMDEPPRPQCNVKGTQRGGRDLCEWLLFFEIGYSNPSR